MDLVPTEDPADLFVFLFDRIGDGPFLKRDVAAWARQGHVRELTKQVEREVVQTGMATRDLVEPILAEGPKGVFAVLCGIDFALERVHPAASHHDQVAALYDILDRYVEAGYLNSDPADGLLLFRLAVAGRPLGAPLRSGYFGVIRVPPESARKVEFGVVESGRDIAYTRGPEGSDVTIGCVPMLGSYGELDIRFWEDDDGRRYRLGPKHDVLADRIRSVLDGLDASGAVIGLLPEAALSEELLTEWRRVIRAVRRPDGSPLRWLIAGTGPVGDADPPANEAVLITRDGGHDVFRYDKQFDFLLTEKQVSDWCLGDIDGAGRAVEDITNGEGLVIRESLLGRVAIVICEDLERQADTGVLLRDFGVSHLFVPVFSAPLRTNTWERFAADRLVNELGAWVVVANSLAVGRAQGKRGALGTCACVSPGTDDRKEHRRSKPQIGRTAAPDRVVPLKVAGGEVTRYQHFRHDGAARRPRVSLPVRQRRAPGDREE